MGNVNGFSGGFAQGFGLMEGHFQRQDAKDRAERLDEQNTQRYDDSVAFRDQQATTADNRYQQEREYNIGRDAANLQYKNNEIAHRNEREGINDKRQASADGMAKQTHQSQQAAAKAALKSSDYNFLQTQTDDILTSLMAGGTLNDESAAVLKKSNFPLQLLAGENYQNTYGTFRDVASGKISFNDPKAIALANDVLGDRLNETVGTQGKDGGTIQSVNIGRLYPMEGGRIAVELLIQTDKGSYPAPLTEGRSSDDTANVKGLPAADLMDIMDGAVGLSESARNNPGLPKAVRDYMIRTGKLKEPGMTADKQQQYDYYKSQIDSKTKILSSDAVLGDGERQQLTQEIAALRTKAEGLIGLGGEAQQHVSPGGPVSWSDRVNAAAKANNADPAAIEAQMMKDPRFQKDAPDQPMFAPSKTGPAASQPPASAPASAPAKVGGIKPPADRPTPMTDSSIKGFQKIDRAAMAKRSRADWDAKPRGEVVAMAVEELKSLQQKARGNQRHLSEGAKRIADDLGLSDQELQTAISSL